MVIIYGYREKTTGLVSDLWRAGHYCHHLCNQDTGFPQPASDPVPCFHCHWSGYLYLDVRFKINPVLFITLFKT